MVFETVSDDFFNTTSTSTSATTSNRPVFQVGRIHSVPAFASVFAFGILVLITNGGLLFIFFRHRNTCKHASFIMLNTLINVVLGAISDIVFRAPLYAIGEDVFASMSPKMCAVFILAPDYFMIAILLCLPLLSIERLVRLETKEHLNNRQTKTLFSCLLVIVYSLAFIITILPTTNLFADGINVRCSNSLVYGHSYSYVYAGLTSVAVILTGVFSTVVVFRLKTRLKNMATTMRKKIVLKQGTVSAISITGLLFVALVPFSASLQVFLMCNSNLIEDDQYCEDVVTNIIFRLGVVLQKSCFVVLPILFLWLNPTLRRKVCLTIKKPKKMEHVVTISSQSMTISKDSSCDDFGTYCDDDDDGDGEFITIAEDLSFGKSGDLKGEVKRRYSSSARHRQSVLDLVDVLSVISEKSECSRSCSVSIKDESFS